MICETCKCQVAKSVWMKNTGDCAQCYASQSTLPAPSYDLRDHPQASLQRHASREWKRLVQLQNTMPRIDILTITGFMTDDQFLRHLALTEAMVQERGLLK
jgi:hypothetical protein